MELDYRPEIAEALQQKCHVLVYDPDGNHVYTGVILRNPKSPDGITIGGRDLGYWLGLGDSGPMIEDREFVSGNSKLSNGDFSLGDLLWSLPSDTVWSISEGVMRSLPRAVNPAIDPPGLPALDHNDIAVSDEAFSAKAGNTYQAVMDVSRPGVDRVGRLWLRVVFGGSFKHRSLLPSFLHDDGSVRWAFTTSASIVGGMGMGYDPAHAPPDSNGMVLKVGPSLFRESVSNPAFEAASGPVAVAWEVLEGVWNVGGGGLDGGNLYYTESAFGRIKNDHDGTTIGIDPFPVLADERYRFEMWAFPSIAPDATGRCRLLVYWYHPDSSHNMWNVIGEIINPQSDERGTWNQIRQELDVPEGYIAFSVFAAVADVGAGRWSFDHVTGLRVRGNLDYADSPGFDVISGRSYTWRTLYRTDYNQPEGEVHLCAIYYGPYKETIVEQGPALQPTLDGGWDTVAYTFTPPAGYDQVAMRVKSSDVQFGSYWLGEGELTEDDENTYVIQTASVWAGTSTTTVDATAPEGTKTVHVEVVAEREAIDWTVDNVSVARTGVTPATGAEVLSQIIANPDTGGSLSVVPGTIDSPSVIPYDWQIRNMTVRDALNHFCTVIAEPRLDWRINYPTRTLDAAPADALFTDHDPTSASPIVFLESDIDVLDPPDMEHDGEEAVDEIVLLGAERTSSDGSTSTITARVTVATGEVDWNGAMANRTRVVSDTAVDHIGYATKRAEDLAEESLVPAESVTLALAGTDRPFDVGDWIYVYGPEAGLVDLTNPMTIDGETVYPKRERVLSRTRKLTPAWRVALRRQDGTMIDPLPGIRWESEAGSTVEVGTRTPEFVSDPQGGNVGNQYLRDRASGAR